MLAAVVGALGAGAATTAVWLLSCEDLDCLGSAVAVPVATLVGALTAFTLTLDIQRWRARRDSGPGGEV